MIALIAFWSITAVSTLCLGLALLDLCGVTGEPRPKAGFDRLFAAVWVGLGGLTALLTAASLTAPLTPGVGLLVLLAPLGLLVFPARRRVFFSYLPRAGGAVVAVSLLVTAVIAALASRQIVYFDTAYYHLPMTRLLGEFGAIPGIVVLHPNFGQTSSWFAVAAPWIVGGENTPGATVFNGYVSALAALHALHGITGLRRGDARLSDAIAAIGFPFVLLWAARWGMIASVSPDLPAMLLAVAVAWAMALESNRLAVATALMAAAFAVSIKLSAAPLLAVAGLRLLVELRRAPAFALGTGSIAAVLVAPALWLGFRASGCLAYPLKATCVETAWTPAAAALDAHAALISSAARGGGKSLPPDTALFDAVAAWAARDASALVLVLLLVPIAGILIWRRPGDSAWASGLAATGIAFVLAAAPTGRFLAGYEAAALGLAAYALLDRRLADFFSGIRLAAGIGLYLIAGTVMVATAPHADLRAAIAERVLAGIYPDPGSGIVLPKSLIPFDVHRPELPRLRDVGPVSNGYVTIAKPVTTGECWAAEPPCSPGGLRASVRYLDPALKNAGGFVQAGSDE